MFGCAAAGFRHSRAPGKSGGGPPQSKTLARSRRHPKSAKRLGVRQPSGASGAARGKRERSGNVEREIRVWVPLSKRLRPLFHTYARPLLDASLKAKSPSRQPNPMSIASAAISELHPANHQLRSQGSGDCLSTRVQKSASAGSGQRTRGC